MNPDMSKRILYSPYHMMQKGGKGKGRLAKPRGLGQKVPMLRRILPLAAAGGLFLCFLFSPLFLDVQFRPSYQRGGVVSELLLHIGVYHSRGLVLYPYLLVRLFLFGTAGPLLLARALGLEPARDRGALRLFGGAALFLAASLSMVFVFGPGLAPFLEMTSKPGPFLGNILFGFVFALALSLHAFLLLPEAVERAVGTGAAGRILSFAATASALVLAAWSERTFGLLPLGPFLVPALVLAAGRTLCRNAYLAFALFLPGCWLAFPALEPVRMLYWRPVLFTFILCFCTACLYLWARSPHRFPPEAPAPRT